MFPFCPVYQTYSIAGTLLFQSVILIPLPAFTITTTLRFVSAMFSIFWFVSSGNEKGESKPSSSIVPILRMIRFASLICLSPGDLTYSMLEPNSSLRASRSNTVLYPSTAAEPCPRAISITKSPVARIFDAFNFSRSASYFESGIYGGFIAANVLKWYWWRFNGQGYFWGMVAGLLAALVFPKVLPPLFPGVAEQIICSLKHYYYAIDLNYG